MRPRWLARHLAVVVAVVVMVNLGLWQLRRLDERQAFNRLVTERAAAETVDVTSVGLPVLDGAGAGDLVTVDAAADRVADLVQRSVVASGTYRADDEVLVRSRSLDGSPGAWVLTPLQLEDGRAVIVNRGFVPANGPPTLPPGAEAPEGLVTVEGPLQATQQRGRFGPTDPPEGRLGTLARADIARLARQLDYPVLAAYVQLRASEPAPNELPVPLPEPELNDGPHLGYAVQWFTFASLTVLVYGLLVARTSRSQERASSPSGSVEDAPSAQTDEADGDLPPARTGPVASM